uniref:Uridine phosphorylase 1 n=1 Tax=Esox lucius TaxID=8010 RepID=A0A3P8YCJ2_ESOLU
MSTTVYWSSFPFIVYVHNPHLDEMKEDILYHFNFGTLTHDLPKMFGDVKLSIYTGCSRVHSLSVWRMKSFIECTAGELGLENAKSEYPNICAGTDLFALWSLSHAMGIPSIAIMLHELIKLLHHAHCTDVTIVRFGTSGGLGIPGTVVVTKEPVRQLPAPIRTSQSRENSGAKTTAVQQGLGQFNLVIGNTMCTLDFYEGQACLDGAFCSSTEKDKQEYLTKAYELVSEADIRPKTSCKHVESRNTGCGVCVTLLDRQKGDQLNSEVLHSYQVSSNPHIPINHLLKKRLLASVSYNS